MITANSIHSLWGAKRPVVALLVPDLLVLRKHGTADQPRCRPAKPVTRDALFPILVACDLCSTVLTVDRTAGFARVPACCR